MSSAPKRRRARHDDDHEEHEGGHERWLVTYADMVTLLMVLFIVMFAMSTVDATKYENLKDSLANGFGHESVLNGKSSVMEGSGSTLESDFDTLMEALPATTRATVTEVIQKADQLRNQRRYAKAQAELDKMVRIWDEADAALEKAGLRGDVRASVNDRGLVISLVSQHVVFLPNIADLTTRGERVVDALAPVLDALPQQIEIDGHTNQVKVKPKYFPTDWELSAARAVHVLRRLQEVNGLPADRLQATGFGHTRPLVNPRKQGSQRVNKRVDLVVLSDAAASTRALVEQLFSDRYGENGTLPHLRGRVKAAAQPAVARQTVADTAAAADTHTAQEATP
ncbi:flagellar motor protein MotB [Nocardioides sp. GY 10113]|uniref:OmpA/MotB family protein n=1 Tax=Nocardioides sp. GY 10113 TaxID=2569761 RepID=UPI0010A8E9DB|nr:flagellar motor protein MotB [Nocardioides sp. GY 10113]TIC83530.1 flagellar motor protein MotB [Nocardioides sp. GY 10113]